MAVVSAVLVATSCSTYKNIAYFQDKILDNPQEMDRNAGIIIEPKDMLSIVVSSRTPELTPMFNLPTVTYAAGGESVSSAGSQRIMSYAVDGNGEIDFPVLGRLKIAGKTRWECADFIKNELVRNKYLEDPVVTVEFTNFKVSVLGEVASPGTFAISGDKVTILQALSLARDLTIFGRRDNVSVIREIEGKRVIYQVDLTSTSLFQSPAYYLKQNDIVYVEPSDIKKRQSTVDDKSLRITTIALSSGSLLVSVATLVTTLLLRK